MPLARRVRDPPGLSVNVREEVDSVNFSFFVTVSGFKKKGWENEPEPHVFPGGGSLAPDRDRVLQGDDDEIVRDAVDVSDLSPVLPKQGDCRANDADADDNDDDRKIDGASKSAAASSSRRLGLARRSSERFR